MLGALALAPALLPSTRTLAPSLVAGRRHPRPSAIVWDELSKELIHFLYAMFEGYYRVIRRESGPIASVEKALAESLKNHNESFGDVVRVVQACWKAQYMDIVKEMPSKPNGQNLHSWYDNLCGSLCTPNFVKSSIFEFKILLLCTQHS